jgi:hypothetical protein
MAHKGTIGSTDATCSTLKVEFQMPIIGLLEKKDEKV